MAIGPRPADNVGSVIRSAPVDGFSLAYETEGDGPAVVLLHGWPGDRSDYRLLRPLLAPHARLVVPDLRGFGESDKHDADEADPAAQYDAAAQARSVAGLLAELDVQRAVLVGYDVGSRVAQALAKNRPDLVAALVVSPPLPGAGERVLTPDAVAEFWYQTFHQLVVAEQLIDGNPDAVRAYLTHFWTHWSGPDYVVAPADIDALAERYSPAGAFTASINWYRAGAGTVRASQDEQAPDPADRLAVPTVVLWPSHDPLFPFAWSDRVGDFFADAEVRRVEGVGHFAPLEYPAVVAEAVRERL